MKSTRRKINVLTKHIQKGKPGNSECCPVALAIIEQDPLAKPGNVDVCPDEITFYRGDNWWDVSTVDSPRSVKRFVNRFDKKLPVKPFSFYLPSA